MVATEEIVAQVRSQLKRKQKARDAFEVMDFAQDTLILQMRAHKRKSGTNKGWGQVTVIFKTNCKALVIEPNGSVHTGEIRPRLSAAGEETGILLDSYLPLLCNYQDFL